MSYEAAIKKAWDDLRESGAPQNTSVKFLAGEYSVDLENKKVLSLASNAPAKDFTAILILHYLKAKTKGLPALTGTWLPFRELAGIEGYYPAFKKRAIEPMIKKYGNLSQDKNITIEAFAGVPVLVKLWAEDAEFGPDANMFFDQSVMRIFCVEDIVVLAGIIAGSV